MNIPKAFKLAIKFSPDKLREDLVRIQEQKWLGHFNSDYHDGGWMGVSLRNAEGFGHPLYPDPEQQQFNDTDALGNCPYISSVLRSFDCTLLSVRLLKLRAGSVIREHRDYMLGYEDGEVRLHIPIITNPQVEFYLDGERIIMAEGEVWYVNVNFPHRVQNLGREDRIHLVVDCKVNDWLADLFRSGAASKSTELPSQGHLPLASTGESVQNLHAFRELVARDAELAGLFWKIEDFEAFMQLVRKEALDRRFAFTEEDLRAVMRKNRNECLFRWTTR
ncbi:MAG: aspartyl/asparaginyl beta-hydroxylase domain-containing protein [Methylomicrobium sp.]|nr:aspartyl/asparaginyl beta-hydroxylase domain-containing protein [Methylomicrobium sp.]